MNKIQIIPRYIIYCTTLIFVLALCAAGLFLYIRPPQLTWITYTNASAGFNVRMPDAPRHTTSINYYKTTKVLFNHYTANYGTTGYEVNYVNIPLNALSVRIYAKSLLTGAVDEQLQSLQGGRLISSSFTTIQGDPAILFKMQGVKKINSIRNNYVYSGEVILRGQTIYSLASRNLNSEALHTHYFLKSFHLSNTTP